MFVLSLDLLYSPSMEVNQDYELEHTMKQPDSTHESVMCGLQGL
jgi:hypothetical protein